MVAFEDLYHTGIIAFLERMRVYVSGHAAEIDMMGFAAKTVYGGMIDFIYRQYIVPPPVCRLRLYSSYLSTLYRLSGEWGRNPTLFEIAEYMGMDEKYLHQIVQSGRSLTPVSHSFRQYDEESDGDIFDDMADEAPTPEERLTDKQLSAELKAAFDGLNELEKVVVNNMVFGKTSVPVLAKKLRMNGNQVLSVYETAIEKMKRHLSGKGYVRKNHPVDMPRTEIRLIVEKALFQGETWREIARRLNRRGIKTPSGTGKWERRQLISFYRRLESEAVNET